MRSVLPDTWFYTDASYGELNWLGKLSNVYYHRTLWLRPSYWRYILAPREGSAWGSWISTAWCRFKGHPEGEIYYNPGGLEPDHRCKNCGEEIG